MHLVLLVTFFETHHTHLKFVPLASSKRVYGTQLSYISMDMPTNLTWKFHAPESVGILTGDLFIELQRLSAPPQIVSAASASSSSSSSTSKLVSALGTALGKSSSQSSILPPRGFGTPTGTLSSTSSTKELRAFRLDPNLQLPSIGADDPSKAPPHIISKKSSRFQLPSGFGATPSEPTSTAMSSSSYNAWTVTLPEPVEMSPAESPYVAHAEEADSGFKLALSSLPVGLTKLKFLRIACSMFGAIAIAEDGSLHYWTQNSETNKYTEGGPVPKFVGNTIVDIAAGHDHYLAVTVDGDMYAWGANQFHQCSAGQHSRIYAPCLVSTKRFLACSAGAHSSLAVDSDGLVYTWGRAQNSVTIPIPPSSPASGPSPHATPHTSDDEEDMESPKELYVEHKARSQPTHRTIAVDCLAHHADAISSRVDPLRVPEPTIVAFSEHAPILQASMSATMGVAVARDGAVFAWGDANAICGKTAEDYSTTPVRIPFPKGLRIVRALAGDFHALALDSQGALWTWGNRFVGGLLVSGAPSTADPVKVNVGSEVVVDFGISQSHSAALTASGEAWVWKPFSNPIRASPLTSRAPVGISHGASSERTLFPLGGPRVGDSVADISIMASQLYDIPYDDISDPETESDVPTEDDSL